MNRIVLIGAGGHGKVAAEIAEMNGYMDVSFVDDCFPERANNGVWPIIGKPERLPSLQAEDVEVFISFGNNQLRQQLFETFDLQNSPVLQHSGSIVSKYAKIASGTLIATGACVNVDAVIGRNVIINTSASVDHDCFVDDFAHISPGARLAGGVSVGARSWIGIGAVVREGVKIGDDVMVGAGAAVVKDIPDSAKVVGVPAKPVR